MARPKKWRKVCSLPEIIEFGPTIKKDNIEEVLMTVEEYETIRLMDYQKMNQEECANIMGVARSTVQRIYNNARTKIADSIVNGKKLKIQGGDYKLCSDFINEENCESCICGKYKKRKRGILGGNNGY